MQVFSPLVLLTFVKGVGGGVLCIIGGLAASLAYTYQMPKAHSPHPSAVLTTQNVSRHCQMSHGGKLPSVGPLSQWQQNRVTVFIRMGKMLALPFPAAKLMVAAVGINGAGVEAQCEGIGQRQ